MLEKILYKLEKNLKVNDEYLIVTKSGKEIKLKSYKLYGQYFVDILLKKGSNFIYENGLGYIENKEQLKRRIKANIIYYYNN